MIASRFSVAVVAPLISLAAASFHAGGFEFPDSVPLEERQVSPEQYQCHSNCGMSLPIPILPQGTSWTTC